MNIVDKSVGQYQLGDCIGKGAFGAVYRGLNKETGEVVAIKQVKLADIPKSEVASIMLEIDLLKKLNHQNIVKYSGFIKTKDFLYIVLEFCENGSLQTTLKKFGQISEGLVAVYVYQVLEGLIYLHEEGVVHRDIKAANILSTKEGHVKLGDFGVATKLNEPQGESMVVGSPYWLAPEVIEMQQPGTASDIWSVGCTVIELLTGEPPYFQCSPMAALFKIVQDDHPPIPEVASSVASDFLMSCFQRDPNLRISAKKLIKHQWLSAVRSKMSAQSSAPQKAPADDIAVKRVKSKPDINNKNLNTIIDDDFDTFNIDLESRLRNKMDMQDANFDEDEEDPFDLLEGEVQMERDGKAKLAAEVADIVSNKLKADDAKLVDYLSRLLSLLTDLNLQSEVVQNHGLLPLLQLLDCNLSLTAKGLLLKVLINLGQSKETLESMCFLGAVNKIIALLKAGQDLTLRLQAAEFTQLCLQSSENTVRCFVSCDGLSTLVQLLNESYNSQRKNLVFTAIEGLNVILHQSNNYPKNEFCMMLSKYDAVFVLFEVLKDLIYDDLSETEGYIIKLIEVISVFTRSNLKVKEAMSTKRTIKSFIDVYPKLAARHQLELLKGIKNISVVQSALDALQILNGGPMIVNMLSRHEGKYLKEIRNQALFIVFNFCRVNKTRLEIAAKAGMIQHLLKIVQTNSPLKQFALPMLCDLSHGSKICRELMWMHDVLSFYLQLLKDAQNPYWQTQALDSIVAWMAEESDQVEKALLNGKNLDVLIQGFVECKSSNMVNLIGPYQKLLSSSHTLPSQISKAPFMQKLVDSLSLKQVSIQLPLLKMLMSILKASNRPALMMMTYDVEGALSNLVQVQSPILVKEITAKILEFVKSSK
ncbi:hypothetical protein MP228_001943 [Amoeboaphelidium protococcarum]|nr:hypothetical protein MP228_001943 [Amoeboaphelidium protococcarum]